MRESEARQVSLTVSSTLRSNIRKLLRAGRQHSDADAELPQKLASRDNKYTAVRDGKGCHEIEVGGQNCFVESTFELNRL